jgi:SAM-dependent methyltransferase
MEREEVIRRMSEYQFFQEIDLGDGILTPGTHKGPHKDKVLEIIRNNDLSGKRVLELGCSNGLFSIEAERQGAKEVLAVDHTEKNIAPLRELLIPFLKSNINVKRSNALALDPGDIGQFDVVIFAGLLYHIRYPFLMIKNIRDLTKEGGIVMLETAMLDDYNNLSMLYCPGPDESPLRGRGSNSCSFFNSRGIKTTFKSFGFNCAEEHLFRPGIKARWSRLKKSGPRRCRGVYIFVKDSQLIDKNLFEFYEASFT